METALEIVRPALHLLPAYVAALERGWSPNNETTTEQRAAIDADAARFVASHYDPEAKGPPIKMPDGSFVPRLPGYVLWIWDGDFCGIVGLRWQRGNDELPPYVLGHIGYSLVPWKRRRGYATRALALMLDHARAEGLASVQITTDPDNHASRRVIEANGGKLVERFIKTAQQGGTESLRYRIDLAGG